jgi:hypothetical protein
VWSECTRVHACAVVRTIKIDSLFYVWSNAVLVILVLAFMELTGVMTYPDLFRHADRVLYAMNRRSATYLGMTIALRSGPFQKYPGCVDAVIEDCNHTLHLPTLLAITCHQIGGGNTGHLRRKHIRTVSAMDLFRSRWQELVSLR